MTYIEARKLVSLIIASGSHKNFRSLKISHNECINAIKAFGNNANNQFVTSIIDAAEMIESVPTEGDYI